MSTDLETALGETPEQPEPIAEAQEATPQEAAPEVQEEVPQPAEALKEEQHSVPLPTFLEMKNEVKQLRQQIAAANAPKPQPAPEFVDPEGASYLEQRMSQQLVNERMNTSEMIARNSHGDALVDEALAALQSSSDEAVKQAVLNSANPYGELVSWHKSQQVAREIGGDPVAYRAKVEAEVRKKIEAEMVAKQLQEAKATPAPSMANLSGTGGGPKTTWSGPTPLDNIFPE